MLLEAAAADPSEPDKDPLWPELVQGLSTIWQGEPITSGMDLMFTESRPRARDAVVSSFAKLALERGGELTPAQNQKLTESFIDLHNRLPALQRREVEKASRKIAGNDVADLMQGKGMGSDDELEVQREYKGARCGRTASRRNEEAIGSARTAEVVCAVALLLFGQCQRNESAAPSAADAGRGRRRAPVAAPPRPPLVATRLRRRRPMPEPAGVEGQLAGGQHLPIPSGRRPNVPAVHVAGGARIGAVVRVTSKIDEVLRRPARLQAESGGVILESAILAKRPAAAGRCWRRSRCAPARPPTASSSSTCPPDSIRSAAP